MRCICEASTDVDVDVCGHGDAPLKALYVQGWARAGQTEQMEGHNSTNINSCESWVVPWLFTVFIEVKRSLAKTYF